MYNPTPEKCKFLSQLVSIMEALDRWEPCLQEEQKQYQAVLDELYKLCQPFRCWVNNR
jgi:hypothetical protein